ncbi:hypothetical protein [Marinobacter sp. SS13-12]|uniref:hypothetical protein n=1 Tax=Marinobacter sp. SS13-12 TaxID=3050451 RepID=UPI002557853C|nr:hypothetical protein [Marinobacter sp. SS13-12]MDK8462017.1 hypothetical protein [Marinobacter sp. SS13-12]
MPAAYKENKIIPALLSVSEDGTITFSSSKRYQIRKNSDGSIEGLTDESRSIIEKYHLNDQLEVALRVKQETIEELAKSPKGSNKNPLGFFRSAVAQIAALNRNADKHTRPTEDHLRRMLFANAFSALESLLYDHLIDSLNSDPKVLESLGSNYEKFKNEKFSLKALISENKTPLELASEHFENTVFHNLPLVSKIYKSAFGMELPDFGDLSKAVDSRHDIVHRNGYRPGDRERQRYSRQVVMNLLITMQCFVIDLFSRLAAKN